jgi:hypothetical protein
MEFSISPSRVRDQAGRWFMVVSRMEDGLLVRDDVTSDLVYIRHSEIASRDEDAAGPPVIG